MAAADIVGFAVRLPKRCWRDNKQRHQESAAQTMLTALNKSQTVVFSQQHSRIEANGIKITAVTARSHPVIDSFSFSFFFLRGQKTRKHLPIGSCLSHEYKKTSK